MLNLEKERIKIEKERDIEWMKQTKKKDQGNGDI